MSTILVIDDEAGIVDNLNDLLETEGYLVLTATNGQDGIDLAKKAGPDLVICDVVMPHLNGYGVLKALRDDPSTATIPFIFLTSKVEAQDFRLGMNLGADDYLTKPYTIEGVLQAVDTRLKKHQAVSEVHEQRIDELRQGLSQVIPHELRTPLGAVLGLIQILKTDWSEMERDLVDSMFEDLLVEGKRLERLVENYSLYAQLELAGTRDPNTVPVFQQARTASTVAIIKQHAARATQKFQRSDDLDLDLEEASIDVSPYGVGKVVEEVVDNACKFSDPGSKISVYSRKDQEFYMIRIDDGGRGMSARQVRQLGSFIQIDRHYHEQQGLGLGLSIARKILENHGGNLDIRSSEGIGTSVSCLFPIRKKTVGTESL